LAAVFLGLGKLLLNGADVRFDTEERAPVENPMKLGYLTMADLACAFDKICCLNGIPTSEWTTNLSAEAAYYVQSRASARESAMRVFRDAKLRHDGDVDRLKRCVRSIHTNCTSAVETFAAQRNAFSEGLSWINLNCDSLRFRKRDGIIFVRMNNDQARLQNSAGKTQRDVSDIKSLSALVASDPSNVVNVQAFADSAQRLLASVGEESRKLQEYLSTITRYKDGS